jgi:membrane peptidoglycan carboxypeptidase
MLQDQPTRPVKYVRQKPKSQRRYGCLGRLALLLIAALALALFTGVVIISTLVYLNLSGEIEEGIAALDEAHNRETFETTRILDRNGQHLWEIFGEGKRTKISIGQIPEDLLKAIIAVEDDTFYENIGLDAPSLFAALIANLRDPESRPKGGSTITQQLVRHIAFEYEERTAVDYSRKTKEVILAWIMNRKFGKDEILEMYLNEIYFGNLAYGVEAAAGTYFDKSAAELTLAESSLLAALPQSPVDLDPLTNIEGAKERQWLVLNLMVADGAISRSEAEAAYLEEMNLSPQVVDLEAPHFSVYVRQLLEEQFGPEKVANGGLRVTTTLDLDYQKLAEFLARRHIAEIGQEHNMTNAALVALNPGSGEILAMLGSLDYEHAGIDGNVNVATSPRQPGSAIKPLMYAAALSPREGSESSWTAADILWDVPVKYEQYDGAVYEPVNYDGRYHGPTRLRDALANSYNVPAVLALQDVGVTTLIDAAGKVGISRWQNDPGRYGLSLTLGGGEVTPLELAAAYGVFANGGYYVPPIAILKVEDSRGRLLYQHEPPEPEPVIDPRVAFIISDILDDDSARFPAMGRNNPLELPFPAAAKTGTTNEFRDNWTVGYTPELTLAVWTGNADNSEMINISGLSGAAPLWSDYMQAVYSDTDLAGVLGVDEARPPSEFIPPPGLERRGICSLESILIGADSCDLSDEEWFLIENPDGQEDPKVESQEVSWLELDPGVWIVPAIELMPTPADEAVSTGAEDLIPQPYCHFEEGVLLDMLPPEAEQLLFYKPPRNPQSFKSAHEWAHEHQLPILPPATCNDELLASVINRSIRAVWRITSPNSGDTVSGLTPIIGTASFDPSEVQFYKVELGMGDPENPQWVTLGEISSSPVIDGPLEMLHADALPPGDYLLRLIVVMWDGNYVGAPYTIQLSLE